MKKTLQILALVAMASALALCACTKDDEPNYNYTDGGSGSGGGGGGGTQSGPRANFTVSPSTVEVGEMVYFTNTSTNASYYDLDFGDGDAHSGFMTSTIHSYSQRGTYTAKLKAYATRDDYYNDRNYSVATRTITVTSSTPTTPSRAYVSRIVLTNWPARQNGNVWDQFATTSTTHPDIQIRIMNGTTELFRSEVVDNCIHPSDGGTTYPSFNVGVTLTASTTYTINIYDEDSFDFVEMGSGTINLASLGSPNYPTTIECSNAHFSFRIYLTWSY